MVSISTLRLTIFSTVLISWCILVLSSFASETKTGLPLISKQNATSDCRQPSFAGVWYDRDHNKLQAYIGYLIATGRLSTRQWVSKSHGSSNFVSRSTSIPIPDGLMAVIVPHATYQYSGSTAAVFYKQIRGRKFDKVFILGPAHREHFHGCALPLEKNFCTPLGRSPVNAATVKSLRARPFFNAAYDVSRKEHSIELQLIMVQQALGTVPIVPIEMGTLNGEVEIESVAQSLRKVVSPRDLVIVSSDFTHYGPHYKFQPFGADGARVLTQIEKLDADAFRSISSLNAKKFLDFEKRTHDTVCGLYPCAVLMAMLPQKSVVTLLDYENSFDVNKAPDGNMVSYMTIVFSKPELTSLHSH